jgi:hypothetical protein
MLSDGSARVVRRQGALALTNLLDEHVNREARQCGWRRGGGRHATAEIRMRGVVCAAAGAAIFRNLRQVVPPSAAWKALLPGQIGPAGLFWGVF